MRSLIKATRVRHGDGRTGGGRGYPPGPPAGGPFANERTGEGRALGPMGGPAPRRGRHPAPAGPGVLVDLPRPPRGPETHVAAVARRGRRAAEGPRPGDPA